MKMMITLMTIGLFLSPTNAWSQPSGKAAFDTFVNKMKSLNRLPVHFSQLDLNRKAKRLTSAQLKSYGSKRKSKGPKDAHVGFTWASDDAHTIAWFPQGIAGLASGKNNARKWLLVSWYDNTKYNKDSLDRGARISFIDITNLDKIRYRHVLLVKPLRNGNFHRALTHAGGLGVYNGYLYVAGTDKVQVFDTRKIFVADGTDLMGIKSKTGVFAYGYRYIMPMVREYKKADIGITGKSRLSFASMDYTIPQKPMLVMGNYHGGKEGDDYYNPPRILYRWSVTKQGTIYHKPSVVKVKSGLKDRVQGGAMLNNTVYLAASGSVAKLWVGKRQGTQLIKKKSYAWAYGTEDLYISAGRKNLWSLTEWPPKKGGTPYDGRRIVFAVKLSKYKPAK